MFYDELMVAIGYVFPPHRILVGRINARQIDGIRRKAVQRYGSLAEMTVEVRKICHRDSCSSVTVSVRGSDSMHHCFRMESLTSKKQQCFAAWNIRIMRCPSIMLRNALPQPPTTKVLKTIWASIVVVDSRSNGSRH